LFFNARGRERQLEEGVRGERKRRRRKSDE
jgi:hypothetical protein